MHKYYCLNKDFNEQEFLDMQKVHHLRNVVNKKYLIDSILICDNRKYPYETMIFPCDENGKVTDSNELYVEHYLTYEEMAKRHFEICKEWEQKK
ncbi:MAG: hypothetical protein KBT03_02345 [Bacteroidales bacterium]|nr:hypothetical protein [Candidatus Scybalousia scybalohippi]